MHVMAGVLLDDRGRVLLAQRPAGKHLAGMWEFPGGKIEPGETPPAALSRELDEEIGILVIRARPLIQVPSQGLLLDAWRVDAWEGDPHSLEGQSLQWRSPVDVDPAILAPADRAILQALRLPPHYLITPADVLEAGYDTWLERIAAAIVAGQTLIQLRLPRWTTDRIHNLVCDLLPWAHRHGADLLLNGDIEGARMLGVGVHLTSGQLATLQGRPLPFSQRVGVSCHDAFQLAQSAAIEADFATLSPVAVTTSHPAATTAPLGWSRFQTMASSAALPVYALGGMALAHLELARQHDAQGVAGIATFWVAG